MDFSKANDWIPHELLGSLQLLLDYLTIRKQRIIVIHLSAHGVCNINTNKPQRSILGAFFFNIFINDLFFLVTK